MTSSLVMRSTTEWAGTADRGERRSGGKDQRSGGSQQNRPGIRGVNRNQG